jgi:hypothetical protein
MLPILIAVVSIVVGLFLLLKPAMAIELQRRFYEKINWRVEPISMQKEIRNTKIMGISLMIITMLILIYFFKIKYFD